jgi:hypothetical protein
MNNKSTSKPSMKETMVTIAKVNQKIKDTKIMYIPKMESTKKSK